MAKFRSWNETEKRFYYFKNGRYYKTADCNKKRCNCVSERICSEFNWLNSEQGFEIRNKTIFINDDLEFSVGNGKNRKLVKCRLIIKNNTPVLQEINKDNGYFLIALEKERFTVLGNIHEGVILK